MTIKKKPALIMVCGDCSKKREKDSRWVGSLCRNCYENQHRTNNSDIKKKLDTRVAIYRAKEENKEKRRIYENNRLKTNPNAKLANRFRNLLNKLVKNHKGNSAESLLKCTFDELRSHLESQFQTDMTWDNWGVSGWHIDHIRPLSSFDLTNEEELKIACHYTNLQPLWAKENMSKGDKWEDNDD